ncbi:PEP-CTERM sorting domain-containing protein [Duganella violaceipulchra]|uniref:PEP-CTERM sorting domain-containing protein n=1 Tax=Duganella violaceipulchra TaxID=2849652 RepID=A0AA41HEQ6_9BURK|nr:PEP-CTERM sorting domain-containing protein [Duganella violaceicalia]MBV6322821.1 hypothetical protein [Duganella violaceicalia]MCP2007901.1 hypothetical protein [Duganella violaceicalia]
MNTIAALVVSASALSVQAYAAETTLVATHAASTVKTVKPAPSQPNMVSVPEPVSYKLILLGIAVLLLFAHRGKKREQPWTK